MICLNHIFSSSQQIYLNHFGCPEYHLDTLHSTYAFFIPIFFSIIFVVTFILSVGYIVEERQNKTKVSFLTTRESYEEATRAQSWA